MVRVSALKCECCGQELKTMKAVETAYYSLSSGETTLKDLIKIVEEETGYSLRSLRGWSKHKEKVNVLGMLSKLALTYTKHSASSVGRALNRDHTTILYHYRKDLPKEIEASYYNCVKKLVKKDYDNALMKIKNSA